MCFTRRDVVAGPLSKYTYVENVWWGPAELGPSTKSLRRDAFVELPGYTFSQNFQVALSRRTSGLHFLAELPGCTFSQNFQVALVIESAAPQFHQNQSCVQFHPSA